MKLIMRDIFLHEVDDILMKTSANCNQAPGRPWAPWAVGLVGPVGPMYPATGLSAPSTSAGLF